MANANTVGFTVIEVVTFVATRAVETSIPVIELGGSDTVSLGEVTTPAVRGLDSGVLVTGGDDVSNGVRRGVLGGGAPVVTRSGLRGLGRRRRLGGLLGSLLGGLLGGLLGSLLTLLGSLLSLLGGLLTLLGGLLTLLASLLLGKSNLVASVRISLVMLRQGLDAVSFTSNELVTSDVSIQGKEVCGGNTVAGSNGVTGIISLGYGQIRI